MSGYLQRLLDRAAATPSAAVALPGGPSSSPVAEADQRLNDPALAAAFHLGLPFAEAGESESDEGPPAISGGTTPRPPIPVAPRPTTFHRDDAPEEPSPAAVPARPRDSAPSERTEAPPPRATWQSLAVGTVAPEDWVVEPPLPTPPPTPRPTPAGAPSAPARTAREPGQAEAAAQLTQAGQRDIPPPRETANVAPPPHVVEPDARTSAVPPVFERAATMAMRAVEPAPLLPMAGDVAAVVPAPPPPVPPVPVVDEAPAAAAPRTVVVERAPVEPEPAEPPEAPAPKRPLTANEASVIGPLARRRRGLTLFGLRRR